MAAAAFTARWVDGVVAQRWFGGVSEPGSQARGVASGVGLRLAGS